MLIDATYVIHGEIGGMRDNTALAKGAIADYFEKLLDTAHYRSFHIIPRKFHPQRYRSR